MKKSITSRVGIGKTIGFLVGALVFFWIPGVGIDMSMEFRIGMWLFYIMMGAFIGVFGTMTKHTVLNFRMPFWFRGAWIGMSMHLLLVLLAYDEINMFLELDMMKSMGFVSPYWALLDGVILGILMDWAATKWGGEGNLPQ